MSVLNTVFRYIIAISSSSLPSLFQSLHGGALGEIWDRSIIDTIFNGLLVSYCHTFFTILMISLSYGESNNSGMSFSFWSFIVRLATFHGSRHSKYIQYFHITYEYCNETKSSLLSPIVSFNVLNALSRFFITWSSSHTRVDTIFFFRSHRYP